MSSGLLPIIIEFQQLVNKQFMKRAVSYCIQADKRLEVNPIMLIVCVDSLCPAVKGSLKACEDLPCYTAPCDYWANRCYVVDQSSINHCIAANSNPDPFAVFCLFLTRQATSIELAPLRQNMTMQLLYDLSRIAYNKIIDKDTTLIQELKNQNELQLKHSQKILAMLEDETLPRSAVKEYALQSLQKKKLDAIDDEDSPSEEKSLSKRMEFVEVFKEARAEKKLRMNWKLCFEEGQKKLGWAYKNSASLRSQFMKYQKK